MIITDDSGVKVTDSAGVIVADDSPALNQWERCFLLNYAVQSRARNLEILVTIPGYCTDAPALLSEVSSNEIFTDGPIAEDGGWEIIMLIRDLSSIPPKKTKLTCNGDAAGKTLQIMGDAELTNSATATFTAGDFSAKNR